MKESPQHYKGDLPLQASSFISILLATHKSHGALKHIHLVANGVTVIHQSAGQCD